MTPEEESRYKCLVGRMIIWATDLRKNVTKYKNKKVNAKGTADSKILRSEIISELKSFVTTLKLLRQWYQMIDGTLMGST